MSRICRRIVSAWLVMLCLLPAEAGVIRKAVIPERASCDGEFVQVTLGLPSEYPAPQPGGRGASLCVSIATGTPYELLSWLENGSLRAVVLPAFAVAVLRAEDTSKFESDYVQFERAQISLVSLKTRMVELRAAGQPATLDQLHGWFATVAKTSEGASPEIVLPHHLSSAVRELLQRASSWAAGQHLQADTREQFLARVVDAIRFKASAADSRSLEFVESFSDGAPAGELTDRHVRIAEGDRLVVRRQLLASSPSLRGVAPIPAATAKTNPLGLFAETPEAEKAMGAAVESFRNANYRRFADGSISRRYFRFSIPELWSIFDERDRQFDGQGDQQKDGVALVLTGGGVKAAYQTRLVDALYRRDAQGTARLTNESSGQAGQRVDYVIGTSGGALLGMFVGALKNSILQDSKWTGLTQLLWQPNGGELKSWHVFPLLDMLRYFSILACLWILWAGLMVGTRLPAKHGLSHIGAGSKQHAEVIEQKKVQSIVRWKVESGPWIVLLAIAPIIAVQICNRKGLEHVPPIAGVYYTLMALVAWYADVSLTPIKKFSWRGARLPRTFVGLAILGVACIAIPVSGSWLVERCEPSPWQVNLCFTGFLLLAVALYAYFAHQTEYFRREAWPPIQMLVGLIGLVVVCYLVVSMGVLLGSAAFLELTGSFWLWLFPTALVLAVALVVLGRVGDGDTVHTPAQRAVGYLFGEYNSRAFWTGHRRFTRLIVIGSISWAWWNFLAAPGLYGNCAADQYFENTYEVFAKAATPGATGDFPLAVPYVVTATSLEKNQERYFLFVRDGEQRESLGDEIWFNIASDGRWLTVREYSGKDLRAAAFASGSPFPVFSSHQVELAQLRVNEQLIDGGFAHNRPLDAARMLGASKVLVLNSSPLEAISNGTCGPAAWFRVGELSCNVPKLLPYLWSRSQVEDSLSSARMLVASIYPTADDEAEHGAWPMLTDFRGAVVDRMIAAADHDLSGRVATIESWGAPQLSNARLLPVSNLLLTPLSDSR